MRDGAQRSDGVGTAPRTATRTLQDAGAFVLLALALSWTPWIALLVTTGDPLAGPVSTTLWNAGGFGLPAAAVLFVAVTGGRAGLRRLLSTLVAWRLGRWYAVLLLPLPVALLAVVLTVAFGPASLDVAGPLSWLLLPLFFAGGTLLGGFEEVAWRGYLLPRLQDRVSALTASIVIGLVWSLWHAPLFLLQSTSQATTSPLWFTLQAVALSVILTWMYNSTGGSLLLAVLFHGVVNGWYEAMVRNLAPDTAGGFMGPAALLFTLIAAWLVWRHRSGDLAARPRVRWADATTA